MQLAALGVSERKLAMRGDLGSGSVTCPFYLVSVPYSPRHACRVPVCRAGRYLDLPEPKGELTWTFA